MKYYINVLTIAVFLVATSSASDKDMDRGGLLLKSKSIVSVKNFVMVPYERLPPQTAKPIKKEFYQKVLLYFNENFKKRSYDITYLSDNLKVKGVVTFPQDFSPSNQYPLIIYNRGGFHESGRIITTARVGKYYANKGYIIFESQYRGVAGGEGLEEFGGREVNDIINLLNIAKSFNFVDEKNTFMIGRSRGGMMTYLAIKHGAKVNAAVSLAGHSDLFLSVQNRPETEVFFNKVIPDVLEDREKLYRDRSAVYWADKIDVPLLLIHGDQDPRVSYKHSIELANELKKYGKSYELKIYPGEKHLLLGATEDVIKEIHNWLKKHKN